jgi:uncharacterized protein (DUF433 family)
VKSENGNWKVQENTMSEPIIITNPEILGGEPIFWATRVPARALLDYLTTVTRERVTAFLEYGITLAKAKAHHKMRDEA